MAAVQNYRVSGVQWFGAYKAGSVLPGWVVERAGPVAELVGRGIVTPTNDPVNVSLRVPEPKKDADPSPAVVEEGNRLRAECERLAADNALLAKQVAALRSSLEARDKSLGLQTETVEHLKAACEEHQAARDDLEKKVAQLTAELDQLTAPA